MTNATNLIHRLAELRAGVLYRIRLHFRRWARLDLHRSEAKETRPFIQYHAALSAIDSCAEAAEVLPEVRHSTRRIYRRLIVPVAAEELTIGGSRTKARIEAMHNALHAA